MIPLIRLLHLIQNVVTLVQFGCKGDIWSSCFHTFIDRILCFLNKSMQDLRK